MQGADLRNVGVTGGGIAADLDAETGEAEPEGDLEAGAEETPPEGDVQV